MDEKLLKIIDDNSEKFNDWITIINDHNNQLQKISTTEEDIDISFKLVDVFAQISQMYFKYGSFRDKFDTSKMSLNIYGPELIVKSEKTKNVFRLSLDNNGIYIETFLLFGEHLRHLDDTFYKDIFYLMELGDFQITDLEFQGNYSTNYNGLLNNNKSKIFGLLRKYILQIMDNQKYIELGSFRISWPYETEFYEVMQNSCLAFKVFYKLNYSLWKIDELQKKKKIIM